MTTRATFPAFSALRVFPVIVALLFNVALVAPLGAVAPAAAADGVSDYSQCEIGDGAGLDCEKWINGILNATHNTYVEDQVVPQRLVIDYDDTDAGHTITLSYMTRKDSSGQNHAYDYLATWNHTFVNADRCQNLNPNLCVGGLANTFPIPSDGTAVPPGGPQPTSAHELPQADRLFVMYGATITSVSPITHSADPGEPGSDYGNLTITFNITDPDGKVMLLFGGHLASGFGPRGWGAGLGAASISGGPYHIRLTGMDGGSVGNRDNQIMSNAIQPLPGLEIAKTTSTPVINAGEVASYTVAVTNDGDGTANGVVITDALPAGVTWTETPDSPDCTITGGVNLSCGPLTIAANSSFSVTVTGVTDAGECPSISNTASFTSDNGGSGDTASVPTVITVNCPSLDVDKTPDGADVQAGDPASFTIVTSNSGAGTAFGVTLTDNLPAVANGWSVESENWAGDCTISGAAGGAQTLTCGPEDLTSGASRSVTVTTTTTADDCGRLDNAADAASTNAGGASDKGDITVLCADIDVDKTPDAGEATAGDSVSFSIVTSNLGGGIARDATLTDELPAVVGGWTILAAATDWADCVITGSAGGAQTLTCGPEDIQAEGSRSVVVETTVSADDCGLLDNLAEVTTSNDGSAEDPGDITVLCADIDVDKTPDDALANAGDSIGFTVLTTNSGVGEARDTTLTDVLPVVVNGWVIDAETWSSDCAITGPAGGVQTLTCGPEDIEASGSRSVTITTTASAEDCGLLDNLAEVATSNDGSASDAGDITVLCPDIEVDKTPDGEVISAGEDASFEIVVSNDGEGEARDVTLTDELPAVVGGWAIVAAATDWADCDITGDPGDAQTLSCGPEDIAAGDSRSVTVTAETEMDDCGLLDNLALAEASNEAASDTDNNSDEGSIIVECPGLNITKEADDDEIIAGEIASFTIKVWNAGPGQAFDVTVHDDLPPGISWEVEIVDPDADDACTMASSVEEGSEPSMSFDCYLGTLPVTEFEDAKVILVTGETDANDCGILDNTAIADASNNDDGLQDDRATILVLCPELTIEKVANVELVVISGPAGNQVADPSVITWTLTYTLVDGPVTNAVISDELPEGLVFLDATDGGTLAGDTVTWTFPVLSDSGSVTLRTTVDPATIDRVNPTENVAVISSDQTPEDDGRDEVAVVVEAQLGGNPTPTPRPLPDTAAGTGIGGQPVTVPVELLVAFAMASLGALTFANVRVARRRGR
jgi:uncharacterized repeat protein (TIGR01451 family)